MGVKDQDLDGGPAFPRHYGTSIREDRETPLWHGGMSLRDYFAVEALMGMLASEANVQLAAVRREASRRNGLEYSDQLSLEAYALADAMLKARER